MNLITAERLKESGILNVKSTTAQKMLFNYLKINKINNLIKQTNVSAQVGESVLINKVLDNLNIHVSIPEKELKNIPKSGPFIIMANHPFGFLDGIIMIKTLNEIYPEFKVLANFFLKDIAPSLNNSFIDLNPFDNNSKDNIQGLKKALNQLRNGNPLGIFPAGEVSTMQKGLGKIEDKEWDSSVIKFLVKANVPIVPMFFEGHNSLIFHLLGKVHPFLRTLSIPSEFFKKENKTIHVRIGKPIYPDTLNELTSIDRKGKYLRTCLFALKSTNETKKLKRTYKKPADIILPVSPLLVEQEVENIRSKALLFEKSGFEVYLAESKNIPNIIRELGRLREITFREVGEGTNQKIDIDSFDEYYLQLFIYKRTTRQIIGAYRVGFGNQFIKQKGIKGFYVNSLFDLDEKMVPVLKNSIELGRSFVIKEFQQKPLPLFLLWQGILNILMKNKEVEYIIGPVSISNDFSRFSKDLLIAFIKKHCYDHELAKFVQPKKEFKVKTDPESIEVILERNKGDLQKLDRFISGIEPGYLNIPVLLKQYIRQNAKIIGFNVDPNFNDSLDGLMILAVKDLPEETYRFLGSK
ncbi:lysophospholipid acyltransferase family protein [Plebeiibacterium sediminum]|uniref:Lysophospholipid acyltransferase family protein n=1 Tax=Plebeiibacterium sediminum TaxID=2992112 RepID=A0AAE3SG27_9BACT|nr:GNAT family N-acyltransferase [Plebeiobacterium sediminum]MCW3788055.1 lysophospholipid acyltransferase family protein [Plebeiobacterium sediminum]